MFAGHTPYRTFPETVRLAYSAKKRGEVAPGVGEATDMFAIGPSPGGSLIMNEEFMSRLETIYQTMVKSETETRRTADLGMRDYINELIRDAASASKQAQEQAATSPIVGVEEAPGASEPREEEGPGGA
jgi:hypothetical protein